jgi:hypothetical protein
MKSQTKTAEPRSEAQILTDIDARNAALAAARHETSVLLSRRRSLLIAADIDAVHEIGSAISRASVGVEIAEAGIGALERELEALYAARREARIAADLAQAHRLAEKERRLVADYAEAAARAVEALAELGPVHRKLSVLNANLPVRVEAVGTHLVHAAKLPGVAQGDGPLWPPRYRIPTASEAAA